MSTLGYDVYLYGNSSSPQIYVPTWSEANGQDDIQWIGATKQGDGSWKARVNIKDHNNETEQPYNSHFYSDENGSMKGVADSGFAITPNTFSFVQASRLTTTGYTVSVSNVGSDGTFEIRLPTWTAQTGNPSVDQDDIQWYLANYNSSNGNWEYTVNKSSHGNQNGTYVSHAYLNSYLDKNAHLLKGTGSNTGAGSVTVSGSNTSQQANGYVTSGLLVYYDGINNTGSGHDNNATVWRDLSGNNNHGILHNFKNKDGIIGRSGWGTNYLNFDGSQSVGIKPITTSNVTIEVVMELNNRYPLDTGDDQIIVSNFETGGAGISFGANLYSDVGAGDYFKFTAMTNGTYRTVTNSVVPAIHKKYSISGSYASSTYKFFMNGVKTTKTSGSGNIATPVNNTMWAVGGNPSAGVTNASFIKGKVYAVRIYNRQLSDAEIQQNYNVDKSRFGI